MGPDLESASRRGFLRLVAAAPAVAAVPAAAAIAELERAAPAPPPPPTRFTLINDRVVRGLELVLEVKDRPGFRGGVVNWWGLT